MHTEINRINKKGNCICILNSEDIKGPYSNFLILNLLIKILSKISRIIHNHGRQEGVNEKLNVNLGITFT